MHTAINCACLMLYAFTSCMPSMLALFLLVTYACSQFSSQAHKRLHIPNIGSLLVDPVADLRTNRFNCFAETYSNEMPLLGSHL